jgi:GAF domain-containing protein
MTNQATLDGAFTELGNIVLGQQALPDILERVVHLAKQVLPVPAGSSITLIEDGTPFTVAFTGPLALALDERQYEAERGPCLDAAASGHTLLIAHTDSDDRWPRYSAAAAEQGVRSSLSVALPVQRNVVGALNSYAFDEDAFTARTIDLAETFAAHAAVAVANAHLYETTAALAEQMKQAMTTRAVIEQAKGIIMGDRRCSAQDAFDLLVRLSQTSHVKLREVAQALVDQVTTPPTAPEPKPE